MSKAVLSKDFQKRFMKNQYVAHFGKFRFEIYSHIFFISFQLETFLTKRVGISWNLDVKDARRVVAVKDVTHFGVCVVLMPVTSDSAYLVVHVEITFFFFFCSLVFNICILVAISFLLFVLYCLQVIAQSWVTASLFRDTYFCAFNFKACLTINFNKTFLPPFWIIIVQSWITCQ